ncbi:hypothetical protein HMPREF0389_00965 [Filifactor alocis ATCC 35896]|jgi:Protein of unknown function (DUF1292).|uniref:UPF0473 protein HMPREF0389_00965 n=1 Tax=Filifactor alocis (strain ATCC 35896 / CCUG 47790 / D40 B5) TaxID=546269 RepID=D6GQJ0_FILAD|nr:DUF1292 domain-containing protein [Filifactor alocis]EFE29043.1 hypothetical protein HMPREF0389_00965 [Filifactor alocis ATCC 35896]
MLEETRIVLTDENGNDVEFELVSTLEVDGKVYAILQPIGEEEAYIFNLKYDENGEMELSEIEDDEEFEIVAEQYELLETEE